MSKGELTGWIQKPETDFAILVRLLLLQSVPIALEQFTGSSGSVLARGGSPGEGSVAEARPLREGDVCRTKKTS